MITELIIATILTIYLILTLYGANLLHQEAIHHQEMKELHDQLCKELQNYDND